ncbi:MAG: bifunctional enoyl-CoA hydratase/phosphate acetyltransferase [Proteobacteria bacterium]|nr:bifunctional enoyl-CoA hydratase/phosphate acetyltransferase [Pseudomonadota bacterium]
MTDLFIENRTFDEITIGETASLSHTVSQRDIDLFATVSGDLNPVHVDPAFAETSTFHHIIIHGMWAAGLISAVLGTKLPGPGTIYLGQDLHFRHPVDIGDTITATLTVKEKNAEKKDVTLDCVCTNQAGEVVVTGRAYTRAPTAKVRRARVRLPNVRVGRHPQTQAILARARGGAPVPTAIVYPVDVPSLLAALDAAKAGFIRPVFIGPENRIRALAQAAGAELGDMRIVDAAEGSDAAATAVALARVGEVAMLMKGDLHTETLMHPILLAETGLRTGRHMSHIYLVDVPDYPRPLLLTDIAINIRPTLGEKVSIVQNAIDFAHVIGIPRPRVAILAAVETVNDRMPSTIDAASLCKMADRGQITGGVLDGPLAFDNAVSEAAAKEKRILSEVAGKADILLVPDLEAGNMLAKNLTFLAGAEAAGVVLGARVPIIVTSRADSLTTRLASCALGVLVARSNMQIPGNVA